MQPSQNTTESKIVLRNHNSDVLVSRCIVVEMLATVRPCHGICDRAAAVHLVHIQSNIAPTTLLQLDKKPDCRSNIPRPESPQAQQVVHCLEFRVAFVAIAELKEDIWIQKELAARSIIHCQLAFELGAFFIMPKVDVGFTLGLFPGGRQSVDLLNIINVAKSPIMKAPPTVSFELQTDVRSAPVMLWIGPGNEPVVVQKELTV